MTQSKNAVAKYAHDTNIRVRSRFEFQVEHSNQRKILTIDQKRIFYFFPTPYQNFEQSQQKLGTVLENKKYFNNIMPNLYNLKRFLMNMPRGLLS